MVENGGAHTYDALFYRYQREGSLRSARCVLPIINAALAPRCVVDIGCGAGAWLSVHRSLGVSDISGIDGEYVDRTLLLIDPAHFHPQDISVPFSAARSYDLVQCLEVGEHVPPQCSETLIDNLVSHGRHILFSAAVPGQGGENHINERPYEFWRGLFAARGYRLFDFIRPQIAGATECEAWYRFNILFFAHDSVIDALPEFVRTSRIEDGAAIHDFSPFTYRVQKMLLSHLPARTVSRLAVWKHQRALRAMGGPRA